MSQNLYWQPHQTERESVSDFVKFILEKKYREGLAGMVLRYSDIPYLEGLADAGVKGAQELIEAIQTHDEIRLELDD